MAVGYTLRTPTQNGGIRHGVTVANPLSRRNRGYQLRSAVDWDDSVESHPATSNPRRRSGRKTVKKAGKTVRRSKPSRRTVTGRYVSRRSSTRAVRNPGRSKTRRSRPQSRTTARASRHVATKKKRVVKKRRAVKRIRVRKPGGKGYYLRKAPAKRARKAAPKRRTAKRTTRRYAPKRRTTRRYATKRRTTRRGRLVRNATQRWITDVHPGTGARGIQGTPMTMAERQKWTARGALREQLKTKAAQRIKKSQWLNKPGPMVGRGAKPGHWKPGVIHPITKKAVGNTPMSARDRTLFRSDGTRRKGVRMTKILGSYSLPGGVKPKKRAKRAKSGRRSAVRKTRKTGRKTTRKVRRYRVKGSRGRKSYLRRYPKRTRKVVRRRTATRRYRVKASRGRKSYMRRYPRKTRRARGKARRYTYRRAGTYRVRGRKGRKGYTRRYPRRVARKTRKVARRRVGVRKYRVKGSRGRRGYMRRYPKRTRKVARKTRKVARRAGVRKYRVKGSRGRKGYMRRYPKRGRKTAKRAIKVRTARYRVRRGGKSYLRRYPKRYRRRGRAIRRYGRRYTRRYARRGARRAAYIRVRVPAKRRGGKIVRKGYSYKRRAKIARNPYKRSRVRVHGYSYTRKRPRRKNVRVRGYRRSQWYPHRSGGRWIKQSQAKALNLLSKREMRTLARRHPGMLSNPGSALAALPSLDQLKDIGLMVGEGLVGFGGAVAVGQALAGVPMVANTVGVWTPVLGNLAAGLGFWALCHFMPDNVKLQEAKPYVMVGVGLAAIVNTVRNLLSAGTIPSSVGQWVVPGYVGAPAVMTTPTATAGLGQIDIYEAALNGVSGIEEELEMELNRMSGLGGDGIFGDANDGIFSGLDGTGTPVREAYAGMGEYFKSPMSGVNVQEAFSGGVGEYFRSPVGEYLETPMGGTMVEQAYAGMGEYFKAPMGAVVEEAFAGGMGFSPEQVGAGNGNGQALMPGFRSAVQKVVRDRIAAGQPMDDAFYGKLGQAAASLARKKFDQKLYQTTGQVQDIDVQGWKPPVTTAAVPNFRTNINEPAMVPGEAEDIEDYEGKGEDEGIFTGGEDEGIF